MTISTYRQFAIRIIGALFAALMAFSYPLPVLAQDPDETERLSGDAYFDFAFRDEANIIQKGSIGGERSESDDVAQNDTETTPDGADPNDAGSAESGVSANAGAGLANNDVIAKIAAMPEGASYRIADLILNCTDTPYCEEPEHVAALLRASGLQLGHLTNARELALSVERLRKTGYFSNIHQTVTHQGNRVIVQFDTVPHTIIRKLIIEQSGELYKSELKKHMILRPGGALYPRTALLRGMEIDDIPKEKLIEIAIDDQVKSLTRYYTKEGSFDAKVNIWPVEIEPNLVDLHVNVTDSDKYVLGKIYIRGHKLKKYSTLESAFRSEFSFFGGITKAAIEDAVEALVTSYRSEGYYQTRIDYVSRRVPQKKTVDVFLDIKEAAHWDIQFEGNHALAARELMDSLTFARSGFVDRGEVNASSNSLQQTYISAGYYWAKVSGEMIRGASEQGNVIVFHIDEGERIEIGEISFDGASVFSRDELLGMIGSKAYSTFGSGAYPQRSMIADDAAKIVDAYRDRGYLNADVPSWTLEPIERGGRFRLTFVVREGEPSRLTHRQIRYTDRETYDAFEVKIDKPETDIFSDNAFRTERAAITKQLRARGHATIADQVRCTSYDSDGNVSSEDTCDIAEFQASCFPDNPETTCALYESRNGTVEKCMRHFDTEYGIEGEPECKPTNGITGTEVDVEYNITLGPKFSFGDTFTHGNVVTHDWVVRQDVKLPRGDTFDYNRVIDARSLLRRRAIYKSASLNVIGIDDGLTANTEDSDSTSSSEHPVPMVINLEEGERRWIDFALGLQLNAKDLILTGEAEFVEANLFGTGWDLRFLIMPEARTFAGSEVVFTQKFNQNFFTLLTLNIPIIPSSGFNLVTQLFYDLRYIPDTNKEEYGWLVELQWNMSKKWFSALAFELVTSRTSSFGIDVSDDISTYHACYPFTFFQNCPFSPENSSLTISLTPRAVYDGRDNPLIPKFGAYAEAKVKLAYSDSIGFYTKPEVRASYVFSFIDYFSLAFNMRLGLSFLSKDSRLPLIDRYFLGGLNMRGYDNEALGPRLVNSSTPNVATNEAWGGEGLFNFTAELRYPIWPSVGIYGAVFADMGALIDYQPSHYDFGGFFDEMFAKELKYTAGLGLRWQISETIPPIVIDYGFLLNRRRGDPLGGFSLNIGYTF